MTKSYTHTPPAWQSKALLAGALAALLAVELAAAAYAYQSASRAQVLALGGGVEIATDVVLKTAMSIAAGLALALGPSVAWHLWRGKRVGLRRQAYLAIAASIAGLVIATTNLSGYSAWTRQQRTVEAVTTNPLYALAVDNAAKVRSGELAYLSGADRTLLREGQALTTAQRDFGDVARAVLILLLVSGMATAYRLPHTPKKARDRSRKLNDTTELDTARAIKRG